MTECTHQYFPAFVDLQKNWQLALYNLIVTSSEYHLLLLARLHVSSLGGHLKELLTGQVEL